MKFRIELLIHKPRSEVWSFFLDSEKVRAWQPTLVSVEPVSASRAEPGAVSKWTYRENEREFSLLEEILHIEQPSRFESRFENRFASNTVNNIFVQHSDLETLWIMETIYNFKTMTMKLLGPLLKQNYVARSQKEMERFKETIENA